MTEESQGGAAAKEAAGLEARKRGDNAGALLRFEEATELDPTRHTAWFRLGRTLRDLGRREEAAQAFERSVAARPAFVDGFSCLSNVQRELGRTEAALLSAQKALRIQIDNYEAHLNEGAAYHALGMLPDALASYALAGAGHEAARHNARVAVRALGAAARTDPLASAALAILDHPDDHDALRTLAAQLKSRGRLLSAAACLTRVGHRGDQAGLWLETARLLADADSWPRAYKLVCAVLDRQASDDAHVLGVRACAALQLHDRLDAHLTCLRATRWNDAALLADLGRRLLRRAHSMRARPLLARAAELEPHDPNHQLNLANALMDLGEHTAARAAYLVARPSAENQRAVWSNLLFGMNCDAELTPEQVFAEHVRFGEAVSPAEPRVVSPAGPLDPERKLRIGYVSPDLRNHSVAFYIEPVLRQHDRGQVDVLCYSDGLPDEVTARLRALGHTFRDVRNQSDETLLELIARDGVDVLIDLAGHTAHNRLRMFARRAAPIQVAWIGYFATTGLSSVDYRLADAYSVPPELERYFVERVVRLPRSANCYAPPTPSPAVAPAPCVERGYVTFGCYNHPRKLSPRVAAVYAEILRRVPGARLKLKYGAYEDPGIVAHVRRWFSDEGIDPARIEASGASALFRYLAAFADIDVALDPFPYGGETTTLHALWMGVPCVALEGSTLVERLGSRVLRVAGLHDWVARDTHEYVAIAERAASDQARLAALRPTIRVAMERSPLLDHGGVTRELEAALRDMWRSYCAKHTLSRTA